MPLYVGVESNNGEAAMKILIIDDCAILRERLTAMLSQIDDIEAAGEATDALAAIEMEKSYYVYEQTPTTSTEKSAWKPEPIFSSTRRMISKCSSGC